MDIKSLTDVMMNPVRQRIIQYLMLREKGTVGEIQKELSDVPVASLYRHMKKLYDAGCIQVIEEKSVRGATEKTYSLVQNPLQKEPDIHDISALIYTSLLSLQASFLRYFSSEDADPQRDMMALQTSTLLLTDEEYMELLQQIGTAIAKNIDNKPTEGRKMRRLTFVSSPNEEG